MTHGWPGSVIELLEFDRAAHRSDRARRSGRGRVPSGAAPPSPGYGFSAEPTEIGWDVGRIGKAWAELMRRLGYDRYVAQGGDVGAAVTDAMGRQAPDGLVGIHISLLRGVLAGGDMPVETEKEQAAQKAVETFRSTGFGYFLEQSTRPQTVGYATLDSPVALAAWMLDHDTDSYYKISRAFLEGKPSGNLSREHIVDNVTTYWLTGTGASAARTYWENGRAQAAATASGEAPPDVKVPVGFTTFPDEIFAVPRSWVEKVYPGLAISTRWTGAGISRPGKSRSSSRARCARRSAHCADPQPKEVRMGAAENDVPQAGEVRLEVVTVPVSDVDRAKAFYESLGWRLDIDFDRRGRPSRPVHASRVRLLDLIRQGHHPGRAGLLPGAGDGRLRHRRGARGPDQPRRRGQRAVPPRRRARFRARIRSAARTRPTPRSRTRTATAGCSRRSRSACPGR